MKNKNIIYIASSVRSGTTLLDLLLGNHSNIYSIGELQQLGGYYNSQKGQCLCGESISECKFWNAIEKRSGLDFNRLQTKLKKNLILSVAILIIPRIFFKIFFDILKIVPAIKNNNIVVNNIFKIYDTISDLTNKPILIDSSKNAFPFRYYFLQNPEKVKIIILYRDGRGVTNSLVKRGLTVEIAAKRWRKTIQNIHLMSLGIPKLKVIRVRYEDLCSNPEKELKRLFDFIDVENEKMKNLILKNKKHDIGGSPTINKDKSAEIKISVDQKWKTELNSRQLGRFNKIAGKMNRKLGYY